MVSDSCVHFLLSLPNKNSTEGYIAPKQTQTVRSKLGWLQMLMDAQMDAGINRQKATPISHHALVGITKITNSCEVLLILSIQVLKDFHIPHTSRDL